MHVTSIGGLLLLALLLRLAFLFLAGVDAPLTGDELAYQQIAENLAAGRGFVQTNNPFFPGQTLYAWQAPLYPLSLGVIYLLLGPNIFLAKLFGVILSTATVYLVYDLAQHIFRHPLLPWARDDAVAQGIARVSGLLIAIYPGFLTHAHLLLSETLFIFLLILAFNLVARAVEAANKDDSRSAWLGSAALFAAAAMAWGLATLTRGIALYFMLLLALWIAKTLWPSGGNAVEDDGRRPIADRHERPRPAAPRRNAVLLPLLFLLAACLVIAPWTLRNYRVFHQFVLLETKGGVNFWLGNSPDTPKDFIRNVWKVGVREPMLAALPADELARDRAGYALGMAYIAAEPLAFIARMPIKFADFWGFERNLVDVAQATTRGAGWNSLSKIVVDLWSILLYGLILLWGSAGFVYAPDNQWKLLLGGFVLYLIFAHLVFFGDARFHLPLIPLFALYAGWMIVLRNRLHYPLPRVALAVALAILFGAVWIREAWAAWTILRAIL